MPQSCAAHLGRAAAKRWLLARSRREAGLQLARTSGAGTAPQSVARRGPTDDDDWPDQRDDGTWARALGMWTAADTVSACDASGPGVCGGWAAHCVSFRSRCSIRAGSWVSHSAAAAVGPHVRLPAHMFVGERAARRARGDRERPRAARRRSDPRRQSPQAQARQALRHTGSTHAQAAPPWAVSGL